MRLRSGPPAAMLPAMTMRLEHLLLALGGVLLGVGLVLGLAPVKAAGVGCGTALTGRSSEAFVSDLTRSMQGKMTDADGACDDAMGGRRAIAWALLLPGAGLLVAGGIVRANARTETTAAATR